MKTEKVILNSKLRALKRSVDHIRWLKNKGVTTFFLFVYGQ